MPYFSLCRSCPNCRKLNTIWFESDKKLCQDSVEKKIAVDQRFSQLRKTFSRSKVTATVADQESTAKLLVDCEMDLSLKRASFDMSQNKQAEMLTFIDNFEFDHNAYRNRFKSVACKIWQLLSSPAKDDLNQTINALYQEQKEIQTNLRKTHDIFLQSMSRYCEK